MTGSSVFLYVGATTLAATVITLCALQMTAAKITSRNSRRHGTLEGPVPGHRSLSSIGLDTESSRPVPSSSRYQGLQPASPVETPKDGDQGPRLSTLPAPAAPQDATQGKLNSLHTIQARSAALQSDSPPSKPPNAKPPASTAPSTQRPSARPIPVQEQGLTPPRGARVDEKPESIEDTPQSAAPASDSEQATAPKTSTSKRARRATPQNRPTEILQPMSSQAPAGTTALHRGPESPDAPQSIPVGDPTNPEFNVLNMFAGVTEAEASVQGLADDLSDIDGGGLPSAAQKTPQKSRR